jgi:hypothetical protein
MRLNCAERFVYQQIHGEWESAAAICGGPGERPMVNRPSKTPGISRIDQPHKHNHGFFVRLQRRGKTHSAFFADKQHGGRRKALKAAKAHYRKLLRKFGPSPTIDRRSWAEIPRRKGSSGIVGVQLVAVQRGRFLREYWRATWSPRRRVVARRMFAVRKHGYRKAKLLAIRARREGLRNMK